MSSKIRYKQSESFNKDLKKLLKRFHSLSDDLKTVKQNAIEPYHQLKFNNQSIYPIPGFCNDEVQICKIKKFACKALKGKGAQSGIRVIYAYYMDSEGVPLVELIEIYFKGDKENEDKERLQKYKKPC
jgi:hypothetical protein